MARVIVEVERGRFADAYEFIMSKFGPHIERIEQLPLGRNVFHITFRTDLPVADIVDVFMKYNKLDLVKLIEGV